MKECLKIINDIRFDDITDLFERKEEIKEKYLRMPFYTLLLKNGNYCLVIMPLCSRAPKEENILLGMFN